MHQIDRQNQNVLENHELLRPADTRAATAGFERTRQVDEAAEVELLDEEGALEFGLAEVVEELFDVHQGAIDLVGAVTLVLARGQKHLCQNGEN